MTCPYALGSSLLGAILNAIYNQLIRTKMAYKNLSTMTTVFMSWSTEIFLLSLNHALSNYTTCNMYNMVLNLNPFRIDVEGNIEI